jgi:Family of unknown function (DUF5675)
MDMWLSRVDYNENGIFGVLETKGDVFIAHTLEHAYQDLILLRWTAKIPVGVYKCVRGKHLLKGARMPLETFEVTGIPHHSGIIFHQGNAESDSAGCILLGEDRIGDLLIHSQAALGEFLEYQEGCDSFTLTVK